MQEIIISDANEGQRLNKFLGKFLDKAPQSFIYKMLRKKNIKYNQKKADGSELLKAGDLIQIYLSDETIANFRGEEGLPKEKKEVHLDILYEDEDILIVNKPTNVLSQKANPDDYTLNEMIVDYYKSKKKTDGMFTPSVCNRLDRNTSGIILAGMSLKGTRELSDMLKLRTIDKYYITVVSGKVLEKKTIKGYLAKQSTHNKVTIYPSEKKAKEQGAERISYIETLYEPLKYGTYKGQDFTFLKVKLITGKTHQIRAHLHSQGYPIIGDGKYGDKHVNQMIKKDFKLKHQLLHAYCLRFPKEIKQISFHLKGMEVTAKPPALFLKILDEIFDLKEGDKDGNLEFKRP